MKIIIIGIDPGKSGGVAILTRTEILYTSALPEGYERIALLTHISNEYKNDYLVYAIEKVGAMPGQGVTSMFTFGFGYGHLIGTVATLKSRIIDVYPIIWKKYFKIPGKKKNPTECKIATISAVNKEYPNAIDLKYHSGIFDAILIGKYALNNLIKEGDDD